MCPHLRDRLDRGHMHFCDILGSQNTSKAAQRQADLLSPEGRHVREKNISHLLSYFRLQYSLYSVSSKFQLKKFHSASISILKTTPN